MIIVNSNIPDNIIQSTLLENMLNIKYLYHESEILCVIACCNFANVQTFRTRELIHIGKYLFAYKTLLTQIKS